MSDVPQRRGSPQARAPKHEPVWRSAAEPAIGGRASGPARRHFKGGSRRSRAGRRRSQRQFTLSPASKVQKSPPRPPPMITSLPPMPSAPKISSVLCPPCSVLAAVLPLMTFVAGAALDVFQVGVQEVALAGLAVVAQAVQVHGPAGPDVTSSRTSALTRLPALGRGVRCAVGHDRGLSCALSCDAGAEFARARDTPGHTRRARGEADRRSRLDRAAAPSRPAYHVVTDSGSGRITTVSARAMISSAGMSARLACSRIASGLLAW